MAENTLLAAMPDDVRQAILPHCHWTKLERSQILYEPGDPVTKIYFPENSVISLVATLSDGNSAEVCIFGRESILGWVSSLASRRAFGRYVVQIGGGATRIDFRAFDRVVDQNSSLRQLLRKYTEALVIQTFQTVACNACHPVEARCCRWILSVDDRIRGGDLPLTHEFLAEMLGVQRSTVSIVVKTLAVGGFIAQRRGGLKVLDREKLQKGSCECYGIIRRHFTRLLPNAFRCD